MKLEIQYNTVMSPASQGVFWYGNKNSSEAFRKCSRKGDRSCKTLQRDLLAVSPDYHHM